MRRMVSNPSNLSIKVWTTPASDEGMCCPGVDAHPPGMFNLGIGFAWMAGPLHPSQRVRGVD